MRRGWVVKGGFGGGGEVIAVIESYAQETDQETQASRLENKREHDEAHKETEPL